VHHEAAELGDTDEAVRWLERAYDDRSGWLMFLPVEPEFDGLREDSGSSGCSRASDRSHKGPVSARV